MFWAREIEHNDLLIWLYFLSCHFEFISKFANAAAIATTPGTSRHSFLYLDLNNKYHQVSNIGRTLPGYKIVDHSDVFGASTVGAAWCVLYKKFYGMQYLIHNCWSLNFIIFNSTNESHWISRNSYVYDNKDDANYKSSYQNKSQAQLPDYWTMLYREEISMIRGE